MEAKLAMLRGKVAQPIQGQDTCPSQAPDSRILCRLFQFFMVLGFGCDRWGRASSWGTRGTPRTCARW